MNRKTVLKTLGIILISASIFALGYLFKHRMVINSEEDTIVVVGPNQAIQNSLSQMNIRDIVGVTKIGDGGGLSTYGQLYYNVTEDQRTEIHVRLKDIPNNITTSGEGGTSKSIPIKQDIFMARRNFDGLDFDYEKMGTLTLSPGENDLLSGNFSTILPPAQNLSGKPVPAVADVERIVFDTDIEAAKNIYFDENADLPAKVRQRPAAFFWIAL